MQPQPVPLDKIVTALTCLFSQMNINSQQVYFTSNVSLNNCDSSVLNEFPLILQNVQELNLMQSKYINTLEEEIVEVKDYIKNIYITAYALPQDCVGQSNGIVKVKIDNNVEPFHVQCENNKHGADWMLIAQRYDDSRLFKKKYTEAEWANGFGASVGGEFFLGLKKIHTITANKPQELLAIFDDEYGAEHYERYGIFGLKCNIQAYKLNVLGAYSGDKPESLLFSQSNPNLTGTIKLYLKPKAIQIYQSQCKTSERTRQLVVSILLKEVETLKARLAVKCNLKYPCVDFYKYLIAKPESLRQINSKHKYNTTTEGDMKMENEGDLDDG